MIRLIGSEWLRFRSRRLVKVLIVIGLVGIAFGVTIATWQSDRPTQEQLTRAEARRDKVVARCIKQEGFGAATEGTTVETYCNQEFETADFVPGQQLRLNDLPDFMMAAAFPVILVGLVIGASVVGASWQTGTITTILTWEPRRIRWFLARLLVAMACSFAIAICLLAVFGVAIAAGAALRGTTTLMSGWSGHVVGVVLRIAGVTAAATAIGSTVAMIGRNTAAALGAVFVYMAVLESLVRGLRPAMSRYMLGDNIGSVVTGLRVEIHQDLETFIITPGKGAAVVALYVAVLTIAASIALRTRDVN